MADKMGKDLALLFSLKIRAGRWRRKVELRMICGVPCHRFVPRNL